MHQNLPVQIPEYLLRICIFIVCIYTSIGKKCFKIIISPIIFGFLFQKLEMKIVFTWQIEDNVFTLLHKLF